MLKQYLISLAVFSLIDGLWLGFIAPQFYRENIGHLMSDQPDMGAATLFYLFFLIGLNVFVITPRREGSLREVMGAGALFGGVTYATFDLTSVAVFRGFPYHVAAVDIVWGATLCATISAITVKAVRAQ